LATIDEIIRSTSTYPVHADKIAFISILERSGKARSWYDDSVSSGFLL